MSYSIVLIVVLYIGYVGLRSIGFLSDQSSKEGVELHRLDRISSAITDSLLQPVVIKADPTYIYIGDWGDFFIKKFDRQGNLVSKIGRGRGPGPGEFTQIGPFDVYRDTVWVVDLRDRSVLSFSTEGTYIDEFRINHPANNIEVTDRYIVLLGLGGDPFHVYDREGRPLKTFGRILDDQARNPIALDGNLDSPESGDRVIYHPLYASYIYTIDSLEITEEIEGVDGQPFPAAKSRTGSGQFVVGAPSTPIEYDDISISNNILYVGKNYYDDSGDQSVSYLLRYEYETLRYLGAIEVPARFGYMEVRNDTLYASTRTKFVAYKMENPPGPEMAGRLQVE